MTAVQIEVKSKPARDLPFPSPLDVCDHGGCPAAGVAELTAGGLRFCTHHLNEVRQLALPPVAPRVLSVR